MTADERTERRHAANPRLMPFSAHEPARRCCSWCGVSGEQDGTKWLVVRENPYLRFKRSCPNCPIKPTAKPKRKRGRT